MIRMIKKAYVVGHVAVKDLQKWDEYRHSVPATLVPVGAKLVCRGKLSAVLAGQHSQQNTVIIEFSSLSAVNKWFESAEYQALIPLREQAADMNLLVFEEDL